MNRFLVKRLGYFPYSTHPTLQVWIPLKNASATNSFATRDDAYAAIGRYVEGLVLGKSALNDGEPYTDAQIGNYSRFTVVEIAPPPVVPTEWTEVAA